MTIDELHTHLIGRGYDVKRDGDTLSAGGYLYLDSLTALPEGVTLSASGSLYLSSLTTLPEGVTLSAGEYLYLDSLTTLPEGVTLSADGALYLDSLTAEAQQYHGQTIRLRTIDGSAMRLISKRIIEGITLWSAQYFRGHLDTDPRCYVAQMGDTYAHGDTIEQALRDLRFKIAQVDFDPDELSETIRQRGTVTFNDYRLLTGACEAGLREGLRERGIDPDTDELPLDQVLELSKDGYGGAQFAKAIGAAWAARR